MITTKPILPFHATVTAALCLPNGGHIILVHRIDTPHPYVTYFMGGDGSCIYGAYFNDPQEAFESFKDRVNQQLAVSQRFGEFG